MADYLPFILLKILYCLVSYILQYTVDTLHATFIICVYVINHKYIRKSGVVYLNQVKIIVKLTVIWLTQLIVKTKSTNSQIMSTMIQLFDPLFDPLFVHYFTQHYLIHYLETFVLVHHLIRHLSPLIEIVGISFDSFSPLFVLFNHYLINYLVHFSWSLSD